MFKGGGNRKSNGMGWLLLTLWSELEKGKERLAWLSTNIRLCVKAKGHFVFCKDCLISCGQRQKKKPGSSLGLNYKASAAPEKVAFSNPSTSALSRSRPSLGGSEMQRLGMHADICAHALKIPNRQMPLNSLSPHPRYEVQCYPLAWRWCRSLCLAGQHAPNSGCTNPGH